MDDPPAEGRVLHRQTAHGPITAAAHVGESDRKRTTPLMRCGMIETATTSAREFKYCRSDFGSTASAKHRTARP